MNQMLRPVSRYTERRRRAVRTVGVVCGLFASLLICALAFGEGPTWKVFSNRAGWSIDYPSDWTISSCRSCKDPTAPEVFVDFSPPTDSDSGWVMIEHLPDKPNNRAASAILCERPFQKFTAALRSFIGVLLVKDQLRDWNDANPRFHAIAPISRAADCSDFCSDPTIRRPHSGTPGHILRERLSPRFSIE
jgi:hypothetical protein